MPLVSRTSLQGNFFKEDTEPPNWLNADLWADTNSSPRALFINDDGTALALGAATTAQDDIIETAEGTDTGGSPARISNLTTAYVIKASVVITPTKATNKVVLFATGALGVGNAGNSNTMRIQEGGLEIASSEVTVSPSGRSVNTLGTKAVLTNVTVAAHTFDVAAKAGSTNSSDFGLSIAGVLIE